MSEGGEFLRTYTPGPEKSKEERHVCVKPEIMESRLGDIWYCFTCHKRYTLTAQPGSGSSPDWSDCFWKLRVWPTPRHRHARRGGTCNCRCGKYVSNSLGPG